MNKTSVAISKRQILLEKELQRYLQVFKKQYHPEKVFLFGSMATGEINEWSDLDLVIIKETNLRFLDRAKELIMLLCPNVGVDFLVYTPQEFESLVRERTFVSDEIVKKGKVLYQRSRQ